MKVLRGARSEVECAGCGERLEAAFMDDVPDDETWRTETLPELKRRLPRG